MPRGLVSQAEAPVDDSSNTAAAREDDMTAFIIPVVLQEDVSTSRMRRGLPEEGGWRKKPWGREEI